MSARVRVTSHTDGQVLWQDAVGFTEYDAERCLQDWARKAWGRQNPYYYNALMCAYSANTFHLLLSAILFLSHFLDFVPLWRA